MRKEQKDAFLKVQKQLKGKLGVDYSLRQIGEFYSEWCTSWDGSFFDYDDKKDYVHLFSIYSETFIRHLKLMNSVNSKYSKYLYGL